ncbi:hypothetical protein AKO1_013357 [Acrasis kona]|uniref:RNA-dependent RNA polymerase n=1 Tax=Acrasis kona TaxID=1008807 RepID=A0AAW2YXL0_9EUKA
MITGSDLDGDRYFVCWDKQIVNNVHQFECGNDNHAVITSSFDQTKFKNWIGIRERYINFFEDEWTEGNYWKIMNRLNDHLVVAVDSPKTGQSLRSNEADILLVACQPKLPHFHKDARNSNSYFCKSIVAYLHDVSNNVVSALYKLIPSSHSQTLLDYQSSYIFDCVYKNMNIQQNLLEQFWGDSVMKVIDRMTEGEITLTELFCLCDLFRDTFSLMSMMSSGKFVLCHLLNNLEFIDVAAKKKIAELAASENVAILTTLKFYGNKVPRSCIIYQDKSCVLYDLTRTDKTDLVRAVNGKIGKAGLYFADVRCYQEKINEESFYKYVRDLYYKYKHNDTLNTEQILSYMSRTKPFPNKKL